MKDRVNRWLTTLAGALTERTQMYRMYLLYLVSLCATHGSVDEDVKLLLHSHEHYDHVGGLAYLQQKTGAEVIASKGSRAPVSAISATSRTSFIMRPARSTTC